MGLSSFSILSQTPFCLTFRRAVPAVDFRIPHCKTVVQLGRRAYETGAGVSKYIDPFVGVKLICGKTRNQIFVSEFVGGAVGLGMMDAA